MVHSGASFRVVINYKGLERCKTIYKSEVTIGRSHPQGKPDLDLATDVNVSRLHARLWIEDGQCFIEDLGSKFGTRVNGVVLPSRTRNILNDGSTIELGDSVLSVRIFPEVTELVGHEDALFDPSIQIGECLSVANATDEPGGSAGHVQQLPGQLRNSVRFQALAQTIVTTALERCREARRGALLLQKEDKGALVVSAFVSDDEPAVSETLARRAMTEQKAFIWRRGFDGDPALSVRRHRIESGMYAPLIRNGRALGALCVDNPHSNSAFDEEDLRQLLAVANEAAVSVASHLFLQNFTCQSVRVADS